MKVRVERDSIDLEELRDCVERRGYQLIAEKYSTMLEAFRNALESEKDPVQVRFVQGQIDALRCCMQLPQILHDEIRAKQRKRDIAD